MNFLSFIFTALLLFATQLHAHCQIPCGVYDDTMRVKMIEEHTLTILKSMNYIASNQNDLEQQNQVTRWIMNKEEHAQEIQNIVSEYFLTQRIKSSSKDYEKLLKGAHSVMVAAMKCKQSTEASAAKDLKSSILAFQKIYGSK